MNKTTIIILALTLTMITGVMAAQRHDNTPVACTMEAKLCPDGSSVGRIGPDCHFATCPTGDGVCVPRPSCLDANPPCLPPQPAEGWCPDIVGGDRDSHGCIPSAGYNWCEATQKCVRLWETQCRVSTDDDLENELENEINNTEEVSVAHSNVSGLYNALLHVKNENARAMILRNLERWMQKHQYAYENITAVQDPTTDNITIIRGHNDLRFLIFKIPLEDVYKVDSEGNILAEHRNFWSYLFGRKKQGE